MRRSKIKRKYLSIIKSSNNNEHNNKIDIIEKKMMKSLITFTLIMLMLLWGIIPTIGFYISGIDTNTLSDTTKYLINFINDILFLSILIFIYFKTLKHDFRNYFNKEFKNNIKMSISYWLIGLGVMVVSNFIIAILTNGQLAENEEAVRSMINLAPLYMAFQIVIYAPLTEELIFRKSIRDIITNRYLFAIISGVIFGGLHVISSITDVISLLYLIPYCSLGIAFGFLYAKSDNIFSTIMVHAIHNSLALIMYFMAF